MIRISIACAALMLPPIAEAAALSPWMGSQDQAPFQLDQNTMVAVTLAGDPLQTGSITLAPCPLTGCTPPQKAAKDAPAEHGTPQN